MSGFRGTILQIKPSCIPPSWLVVSYRSHPVFKNEDGFPVIPSERKITIPARGAIETNLRRKIAYLTQVSSMAEEHRACYDDTGPQISGDEAILTPVNYEPVCDSIIIVRVCGEVFRLFNLTDEDVVIKTGDPFLRVIVNGAEIENVVPDGERYKAIFQ